VHVTDLVAAARRKAHESAELVDAFFTAQAPAIEACARAIADRLASGGTLYSFGNGGSACDAQHVAVELMHPIFEKRRAFAAHALPNDVALASALGNDRDYALGFARQLELYGKRGDIALGISTSGQSANVVRALRAARGAGLLAVGFAGRDGGRLVDVCDHVFVVPSYSIHRIQEVHTVLLHILWDLVHLTLGEEDVL
jgi:D-sedoheptulose 7-phosphate isomerase